MAYDNTNTGTLFKNDRKEKDTHPDYRGAININGQEFWLSAWIREAKGVERQGQKFMSLSVQPKEPAQKHAKAKQDGYAPQPSGFADMESDIPF